jgi:hypothetical protein
MSKWAIVYAHLVYGMNEVPFDSHTSSRFQFLGRKGLLTLLPVKSTKHHKSVDLAQCLAG